MTAGPGDEVVVTLRTAARALAQRPGIRDLEETLRQIVASAVRTVPGVDAGSLSMTRDAHVDTRHPTNDVIRALDETQSELREGPCISAIQDPPESGVVVAQDLAGADAERWPRFAPRAVEAGYRGLMSTHLTTDASLRVALNLYAARPDAYDVRARVLAGLFGVQAGLLLYGAQQVRHLQRAVDSRDLIGRAKGVLAERFGIDDETAFGMLVTSSQETNMKVTAVAQWVVDGAGPKDASRAE
ncbi:GAF and ANTAR domain-containing protein [Actinomycetospora sp. CA-101289]|uniref:GAF and ANTAR domain-containing protein n=1 Tax=Actinomycetospora sp. CA-101289 TaxID=3239893 RepID=UPI003D97EBF2